MTCPSCQHANPPDSNFCLGCGSRLSLACASCGVQLPAGSRFCNKCGTPLTDDGGVQPRFHSPETYTPKHLADKILTSRTALEGERKQVTVLFADLKGSMELLADRDPEDARRLLDPVLEHMMEAVHRYEGTVNQVLGDGVMALFGAPVALEDHAVRACYAALRMQESVREYAESVHWDEAVSIQIRVGMNSGDVVVRSIGSDLRMDYTAVGQTTHLAARMEQLATPGSIVVAPETLRLVEAYVTVRPLGAVNVKGLSEPLDVYELVSAAAPRTRLERSAARGLTRFVGRDDEMSAVDQALQRVSAGHGQVLCFVGEAGVGKSRLVRELRDSPRVREWRVLETASVSLGQATPYLPVIGLLKAHFHVEDRDGARRIRERVTGTVLRLDRALEPTLPALLALLDVPPDEDQWPLLDPSQRRQRTLDAIRRLLLRESQVQPLLLVFEDLHWIDRESQGVLDSLVEGLAAARVLFLFNFRPEYEHRWGTRASVTQMHLEPLPAARARELLDALLGQDAALDTLKDILVARTNGNPFFLEECVRSLVETGTLEGDAGHRRLTRAPDTVHVPPTVQAVLASRIDRLAPDAKRLLQTASVIGKDVPFPVLMEVTGATEPALRAELERLQSSELLDEVRLFPDPEYTFKHALSHEVAYGTLLQDRRRTLHRSVVAAIERLYAERLTEQIERLAHHGFRGEAWDKAAGYALQAGRRAMDRSAALEACGWAEQGLVATDRLAASRDVLATTLDLRVLLLTALFPLGETERLLINAEAMLVTAERLGDERRVVDAKSRFANTLWLLGKNLQALPMVEDAVAEAQRVQDSGLQVLTGIDLGQVCRSMGDYRRAVDVLDRVIGMLRGPLAKHRLERTLYPFVTTSVALSFCLAQLGELERANDVALEAVRFAEAARHPASLQAACAAAGHALVVQGRFAEATPLLERALEAARVAGLVGFQPAVAARLALAYARAARLTDAVALATDAAHRVSQTNPRDQGWVLASLAEVHWLARHAEDARTAARRAVEISRELAQRGTEAHGLWLLAEVAALERFCDIETLELRYRDALDLATELRMRPLVAHCHLSLGKLFCRTGKREQGQNHLAIATTMFREMGMRFWLERAAAEALELGA